MKALYRRYRPMALEDVVGQEQVIVPLSSALAQGKFSHAYLFGGPRGCGKTSVARILAHKINGFEYRLEDNYVDIIEIDGASNRGIDNIRELREKVNVAPSQGKYKIYIIDEVHMLTKEAFNALLKTLEEPPEHAVFIMATTDVHKVPTTILSRVQMFTFKLVAPDIMTQHLRDIADKECIKIDDRALSLIVKSGEGSFRDSLSLLDQISTLSDEQITAEMVSAALGLSGDSTISALLSAYLANDLGAMTKTIHESLNNGVRPETLNEELIKSIIERPKPELLSLLSRLSEIKPPFIEAKLLVALTYNCITNPHKVATQVATSEILQASRMVESRPTSPMVHSDGERPTTSLSTLPEPVQPAVKPAQVPQDNSIEGDDTKPQTFDWNSFMAKVQGLNDAIYLQLTKVQYEFDGATLHIYPMKKVIKSILSRDNNKRILSSAAENVKITIHEADESPSSAEKDETLSRLSAIMGGEVKNDGGENPF